jgi:hypothetical protein
MKIKHVGLAVLLLGALSVPAIPSILRSRISGKAGDLAFIDPLAAPSKP